MKVAAKLRAIQEDFSNSDWMTVEETAVFLRLFTREGQPCVFRVRNLVHQGRLPSYKPFGRLLFKRSELQRYIEASRQG